MGARKIKNRIHFSFIILFVWFVLTKDIFSFVVFCTTVLSHEFGHYFVAKKLGYRLNNFVVAPYGVCLNYKEKYFEANDEILIALAGPAINLILSIFCISLWWIFPSFYGVSYSFVSQSLMLGLFNLLPCYPLDGGRMFVATFSKFVPRTKAVKTSCILNLVVAILLFLMFLISCFINFNPSLCACAVFMVLSSIESKNSCKYDVINLFDKNIKNYSRPLFLVVKSNEKLSTLVKHIEANKFTIFIVIFIDNKTKLLDEQAVKVLMLAHPLEMQLCEIFKQDKG